VASRREGGGAADPVRRRAVEALIRIEGGNFLEEALAAGRSALAEDEAGRGRLHFLTAGVTKWRGRLDYELDRRLPKGTARLSPAVRNLLRLGLFELRQTNTPAWAAVDSAVRLVRELGAPGLASLVNGVLRRAAREGEPQPPEEEMAALAVTTSHPLWLLERMGEVFGASALRRFAEWNNRPPEHWVRIDLGRCLQDEAVARLAREGAVAVGDAPFPGYLRLPEGCHPDRLEGLHQGWLTVQDPSAGLASWLLDPQPGWRVADLFAAPGGKATHLAELLGGSGSVDASDADPVRQQRLEATVRRHGSPRLRILPWGEMGCEGGVYDAVLADVPCSNLGVLRRRADARWRVDPSEVARLADRQVARLIRAAELVRPGGVLVYSTCTVLPEENGGVVARFLERQGDFERSRPGMSVPEAFITGEGAVFANPWTHGIDGAYAARLKRRG
jgi:16S rRNA (cytosine967-C5)-methyltransferase